jgi:hypothetical protein
VLSKATWSKWEGLDPARERRQLERERQEENATGGRDAFTEEMRRLIEVCEPHKSGPFVGTDIGYDPDSHNANCRLTPVDRDKEVERFTRELGDELARDKAITNPIADPRSLLRSLTPEQRDYLYQQYQQNKDRWAAEAANQAALQEELRKNPDLARELEAEIARRRAEWQDATSKLAPWQRQRAAPWLYSKDYTYFAPTLTEGPDGLAEFGFAPTPALRRLQLMQGLLAGVQVFGNADEALYFYRRDGAFRRPETDEEALGWYQLLGATRPDKLAEVRVSGGGLISSNSDLQLLVPAGALRGAIGNLGSFLLRITGEIASNAAWAVAADKVAEKYGPAAGAAVPYIPTLIGVLRRTVVIGAASKGFSRRYNGTGPGGGPPRPNPHLRGKTPQPGTRTIAKQRATALEVELVQKSGKGTVKWRPEEIAYIKREGKLPEGIVGHHINSVAEYPKWEGDPRNIKFVRGLPGNLAEHGGAFQNRTQGPLIDRQALVDRTKGSK